MCIRDSVPTVTLGDQVTPDAHTWRGVRTGWTLLRVNAGRRPTRFFPITTWRQVSPAGVRLGVVQRRARRRPLSLLIGPVVLIAVLKCNLGSKRRVCCLLYTSDAADDLTRVD